MYTHTHTHTHTHPPCDGSWKEIISEALEKMDKSTLWLSHSRGGKESNTSYAKLCKTSLYNFGFHDIGFDRDKITEKQSYLVHMRFSLPTVFTMTNHGENMPLKYSAFISAPFSPMLAMSLPTVLSCHLWQPFYCQYGSWLSCLPWSSKW